MTRGADDSDGGGRPNEYHFHTQTERSLFFSHYCVSFHSLIKKNASKEAIWQEYEYRVLINALAVILRPVYQLPKTECDSFFVCMDHWYLMTTIKITMFCFVFCRRGLLAIYMANVVSLSTRWHDRDSDSCAHNGRVWTSCIIQYPVINSVDISGNADLNL